MRFDTQVNPWIWALYAGVLAPLLLSTVHCAATKQEVAISANQSAGAAVAAPQNSPVSPPRTEVKPSEAAEAKPPELSDEQCQKLASATLAKLDETPEPLMRALLADAQARCPTDRRYHLAQGFVEVRAAQWSKAAEIFTEFVIAPNPPMPAFSGLAATYSHLDATEQQRIQQLGTSSDSPIYVPTIRAEYLWVNTFGCTTGKPQVQMQSLVAGKSRMLDCLHFRCANGSERALFFDFSADPMEQQLQENLKGGARNSP